MNKTTENFITNLWAVAIAEQLTQRSVFLDLFYERVERTWLERLFSFSPLRKYKLVQKKQDPESAIIRIEKQSI